LWRLAAALFYSGVFWATVLFLIDACALDRRIPFLGVGAALAVLMVAAVLFTGVVASSNVFAMVR
jgi:hypothetical protein